MFRQFVDCSCHCFGRCSVVSCSINRDNTQKGAIYQLSTERKGALKKKTGRKKGHSKNQRGIYDDLQKQACLTY